MKYIIAVNPKLIEDINQQNKKLMEQFLTKFATKYTSKTIVTYRLNLNIFFCWNLIYNDNLSFINFNRHMLFNFLDYCCTKFKYPDERYIQMNSLLLSFSLFVKENYKKFSLVK